MMMIGLGLAVLGAGIGFGLIGHGALTGMARQPEAHKQLQTVMLIAFVFVELLFLLTLFVDIALQGHAWRERLRRLPVS